MPKKTIETRLKELKVKLAHIAEMLEAYDTAIDDAAKIIAEIEEDIDKLED